MRYLALGLFAEGPSDHEFLPRLIFRSITQICAEMSDQPVEISEQFIRPLPSSRDTGGLSRPEKVAVAFGQALESLDLLFIQADGGEDAGAAYRTRVEPCRALLREKFPALRFDSVGVVPVYETEAWAIADAEAVVRALGTTKTASELGLPPSPQRAENQREPKEVLRNAQLAVREGRQQSRLRIPPIHGILGETVSLVKLRQMMAFRTFEAGVRQALRGLWGVQA